jgi:hypothetical protein
MTVVMNERSRLTISAGSDELKLGSRLRLVEIRLLRAVTILEDPRFTRQGASGVEYDSASANSRYGDEPLLVGASRHLCDMLPTSIVAAAGPSRSGNQSDRVVC